MHTLASSGQEPARNGQPRIWSYEALRLAELLPFYAGDPRNGFVIDLNRPFNVGIPLPAGAMEGPDFVLGESCVLGVGPVGVSQFERWLIRLGMATVARKRRAREAYDALTDLDRRRYEWRNIPGHIPDAER